MSTPAIQINTDHLLALPYKSHTIGYWTGENPISDPGPFPGFTNE